MKLKKKLIEEPITYEEVIHAVHKSKNDEAPGPDCFTIESFKIFIDKTSH